MRVQIQPNLSSNCDLTKLQEENNALKLKLRDVEDCYDSLKREVRSFQDENKSLMTALRLLNNEFVIETKYRNGRNEDSSGTGAGPKSTMNQKLRYFPTRTT